MTAPSPKLFISYSWTSDAHQKWVLSLATDLREHGVDVILDKWDLREGNDAHAFMEKMVADPLVTKVALICDRQYAAKANDRSGGVGTETQIITPGIYARQEQSKFVAVLPERGEDGNPFLPVYYGSRIYIDLSKPEQYDAGFEQLLRWIFDKPLHKRPELGRPPEFLAQPSGESFGTSSRLGRALRAIREARPNLGLFVADYFGSLAAAFDRFRVPADAGDMDEAVLSSIERFLPLREEAYQLFRAVCQYPSSAEAWGWVHKLFEALVPYLGRPAGVTRWHDTEIDPFRFLVHELFLHAIAAFMREERFDAVQFLTDQHYYVPQAGESGRDSMVPFTAFCNHIPTLDRQNQKKGLNRLSLHADYIKNRARPSGASFEDLMQADFVLFLRAAFVEQQPPNFRRWWPETLVFAERRHSPFEVFARSQSKEYYRRVLQMIGAGSPDRLKELLAKFKNGELTAPRWQYISVDLTRLMGYEKLGSRP
jgi:hypothetical protein